MQIVSICKKTTNIIGYFEEGASLIPKQGTMEGNVHLF